MNISWKNRELTCLIIYAVVFYCYIIHHSLNLLQEHFHKVNGLIPGWIPNRFNDSELLRSVVPTKRVVYTTTRPTDIKNPYEKMVENEVEFGSPDKRSGGFLNSALVSLHGLIGSKAAIHANTQRYWPSIK